MKLRNKDRASILMRRGFPAGMTGRQRVEKAVKKAKFAKLKNKLYRKHRPLGMKSFHKVWRKIKKELSEFDRQPVQRHVNYSSIYKTYFK